jgi:signal transduction histidine kinase
MAKVADSLISLYKIALPFCERKKISLNLDLVDPSFAIDIHQRQLTNQLKTHLQGSILRTKNGAITLGAKPNGKYIDIFIKDTGSSIPKEQRMTIASENPNIDLHSRHGYGTTITIQYPKAPKT